jgi:hypothetical protein
MDTMRPIQFNLDAAGGDFACRPALDLQGLRRLLAIAALSLATAGCSVMQEREPPQVSAERTPVLAIEAAFSALNYAPPDTPAVNGPNAPGSCNDLEFSFLNSICSKKHKKRVSLKQHRVATFVIGRTSAIASPAETADPGQVTPHSSDVSGKGDDARPVCAQTWPYYDWTCLLKQTGGTARIVRVIPLNRQTSIR